MFARKPFLEHRKKEEKSEEKKGKIVEGKESRPVTMAFLALLHLLSTFEPILRITCSILWIACFTWDFKLRRSRENIAILRSAHIKVKQEINPRERRALKRKREARRKYWRRFHFQKRSKFQNRTKLLKQELKTVQPGKAFIDSRTLLLSTMIFSLPVSEAAPVDKQNISPQADSILLTLGLALILFACVVLSLGMLKFNTENYSEKDREYRKRKKGEQEALIAEKGALLKQNQELVCKIKELEAKNDILSKETQALREGQQTLRVKILQKENENLRETFHRMETFSEAKQSEMISAASDLFEKNEKWMKINSILRDSLQEFQNQTILLENRIAKLFQPQTFERGLFELLENGGISEQDAFSRVIDAANNIKQTCSGVTNPLHVGFAQNYYVGGVVVSNCLIGYEEGGKLYRSMGCRGSETGNTCSDCKNLGVVISRKFYDFHERNGLGPMSDIQKERMKETSEKTPVLQTVTENYLFFYFEINK